MRELYFDVWAGDDLLGTSLGELTDASDKRITAVDNGMGSGQFTISRHSSQYDWVTPGPTTPEPLIRWRRVAGGPFAYDDARYKDAFFVEEGSDIIVSGDEEGGEDATRSGRSVESILDRAVIDFEAHYSDDIVHHPYDKTALIDGQWHFDEDIPFGFSNVGTPGAVLRVLLRNAGAQTPEPIPEVTHDFNINVDSNGDAWPDGDAKWSMDVGTSLLDVLGILVNSGLYYKMTPDLVLHAWQDPQGTDLSGSISLIKADKTGAGIATSGERTIHASPAKSRMLVKGQTTTGGRVYRWVADTGIEAVLGVRQGSLDYQASPTNAILDKAGNKSLADLKAQHDGPPTMGVDEMSGQEPFIDYFPGDTVTVDIPGVFDTEAVRIFSITLAETDTGEVDPTLEFSGEAWSGIEGPQAATGRSFGDPFFMTTDVDFIGGGGESGIRFRPEYGGVGAQNGTADADAWWLVDVMPAGDGDGASTFEAFVNTEDGRFADLILSQVGFEVDGDKIEFNVGVGSGHNDDKFYVNDGWGIVMPRLPADPDGAASEEGQFYFNTDTQTIRWYDGTVWADLGSGSGTPFEVVGVIAECNTSPTGSVPVPFDTFYDIDFNDLSGVLPAGVELTYAAGVFTATADGFYRLNLGVDVVANPGSSGYLQLTVPSFGYPPRLEIAASGNDTRWVTSWAFPMRSGQTFRFDQGIADSVDGYATLEIYRTAAAVS